MRDSKESVEARREEKRAARRTYKAIRNAILPEDKTGFDGLILRQLLDSVSYRYSGKILVYASIGSEVDTVQFCKKALADGRELYLPKSYPGGVMRFFAVNSMEELHEGAFGVAEPEERDEYAPSAGKADLCIVPGVCFDVYGYRVGYGKGYYDRFLAKFTGVSVGLAYEDCFCREKLPYEKRYDKPVDFVVTEKGMYSRVCP